MDSVKTEIHKRLKAGRVVFALCHNVDAEPFVHPSHWTMLFVPTLGGKYMAFKKNGDCWVFQDFNSGVIEEAGFERIYEIVSLEYEAKRGLR